MDYEDTSLYHQRKLSHLSKFNKVCKHLNFWPTSMWISFQYIETFYIKLHSKLSIPLITNNKILWIINTNNCKLNFTFNLQCHCSEDLQINGWSLPLIWLYLTMKIKHDLWISLLITNINIVWIHFNNKYFVNHQQQHKQFLTTDNLQLLWICLLIISTIYTVDIISLWWISG